MWRHCNPTMTLSCSHYSKQKLLFYIIGKRVTIHHSRNNYICRIRVPVAQCRSVPNPSEWLVSHQAYLIINESGWLDSSLTRPSCEVT